MAEELQQTAEGNGVQPAPPQPPAPPAEKTFTQDEVNVIVQRRLAQEREKRPPAPEAKLGEAPKGEDPKPDDLSRLNEQLSTLSARLAESEFATKVAGLALDEKQKGVLKALWNPAAPEAMDAAIEAFGVGKPKPATSTAPPAYSPAAANGAPDGAMERDATKWTSDYIAQLRADGKFRERLEEYRNSLPGGGADLFRKRIPKAG